jgi:hypothetical protein
MEQVSLFLVNHLHIEMEVTSDTVKISITIKDLNLFKTLHL